MEKNILKDAASVYERIKEKRYMLCIKRKGEVKTLTIFFPIANFYHLVGLNKLKDIPIVQRKAKSIYKEILDEKITYQNIENSVYIDQIKDRLFYFQHIEKLLSVNSLYFKSLHGKFKGIEADFVLTTKIDDTEFVFLFFAKEVKDYLPCSFFNRNEQKEYTKEGTLWKIESIREISYR